jgi:hypothetical protein
LIVFVSDFWIFHFGSLSVLPLERSIEITLKVDSVTTDDLKGCPY